MKVLICGPGIARLALAQRMQSHGWEVCIVELATGPRDQGYMLDFIGPGYDAAEAMGVLPRQQEVTYRRDEVAYMHRHGRRRERLDYTPFARLLKGRLLSIMRPHLGTVLREEVTDHVDFHFGCSVVPSTSRRQTSPSPMALPSMHIYWLEQTVFTRHRLDPSQHQF